MKYMPSSLIVSSHKRNLSGPFQISTYLAHYFQNKNLINSELLFKMPKVVRFNVLHIIIDVLSFRRTYKFNKGRVRNKGHRVGEKFKN